MPDCELHRTNDNPNCEVIEVENGSDAIVPCRNIAAGEFFVCWKLMMKILLLLLVTTILKRTMKVMNSFAFSNLCK